MESILIKRKGWLYNQKLPLQLDVTIGKHAPEPDLNKCNMCLESVYYLHAKKIQKNIGS